MPAVQRTVTYEEQSVAAVLMGEAWSDGSRGMTAVAEVIHQRAVEKHQTPLEVISVHRGKVHAFSCLNHTTMNHLIDKFSHEPDYQRAPPATYEGPEMKYRFGRALEKKFGIKVFGPRGF